MSAVSGSWRAVIIQSGPCGEIPSATVDNLAALVRQGVGSRGADVVVLPELATLPYFCLTEDSAIFDWAEPIDGPTVRSFSALCRELSVNMVVPLFERGPVHGEYYDSAVLLGRDGRVIPGLLPDGREVLAFRKVHTSCHADYDPKLNEKLYFRGGPGFPIYSVDGLRVACLICYDRSFPESWRSVALAGADIVVVPSASFAPRRATHFVAELAVAAIQNGVFCLAANKGGREAFRGTDVEFFGLSVAIDPFGQTIALAPQGQPDALITAELDFALLDTWGRRYHYMRDRRPDAYSPFLSTATVSRRALE